ncbi:hypothetical protein BGX27_000947, partial [Mortierella sp. AM989]
MTPNLSQPQHTFKHPPRIIDNGSLILQDIIGVGAYGSVYRALDIYSGQIRAVKCLSNSGLNSRQRDFQLVEAKLHASVSGHPNIATLHKVIEDDDYLYMVLDYGDEGDLFSAITERGGFVGNDMAIKSIFGQIADAVLHCHANGVYHRDLKPENIILFRDSVKLVDFGLATHQLISTDFGCGSTFYLSPECQGGFTEAVKSYDSAANDVWSLGVILINLVFGRNPWKQACARDETFLAFANNNDFLQTILPMTTELNDIVKAVFCLDPKRRISLSELADRVKGCQLFSTLGCSTTSTVSTASATVAAAAAAAALASSVASFLPEEKDQGQDSG